MLEGYIKVVQTILYWVGFGFIAIGITKKVADFFNEADKEDDNNA